jgi:ABC-2 type transport system ATP-binding protein
MMRRLEIAQTLVNRPQLLYLDEPSIGLDPNARRTIWEHIEKLRHEYGTTILLTTHDMNEADRLCQRIGIMDKGKLVTTGEPAELKASLGGDIISIGSRTPDLTSRLETLGYSIITGTANDHADIVIANGERRIPELLEVLRTNGIGVETVSLQQPTLDDVFLSFTGSRIEQSDTFTQARRTRRTVRRLN